MKSAHELKEHARQSAFKRLRTQFKTPQDLDFLEHHLHSTQKAIVYKQQHTFTFSYKLNKILFEIRKMPKLNLTMLLIFILFTPTNV